MTPSIETRAPVFSLREFLLLLVFNTLIAVFLTFLGEKILLENFIFAQSIGISIYGAIKSLMARRRSGKHDLFAYLLGIPFGGVVGVIIGALLTGTNLNTLLTAQRNVLLAPMAAAMVFGVVISYYFYTRGKLAENDAKLQEKDRLRADQERILAETELRLLQAQIEPHFLFNTLSNVVSLIDTDPENAKRMLAHLSAFLRTSLRRARGAQTTVRDELCMLEAYLSIQKIRMAERLSYTIDCDESLLELPLVPLLIQPLVENAVKHGLEKRIDGGHVEVVFSRNEQSLAITVRDTGDGFVSVNDAGFGLKNIRDRVQRLYGSGGELRIGNNQSHGVIVRLELPLQNLVSQNKQGLE